MDTCCLFAVVNICLLIRSDRFAKRQAITNLFIIKSIYYGSEFKQRKDLIGLKRLNGGIRVCVCGYDSIMGIRRKEAGKDAPEQSAFLALEEAERRMGGRSMQFDCCTADGEGGLQ